MIDTIIEKNTQPIISIVTVVYNDEKYLEKTIKSIISQTYHNIEYIIIDGGSTDGTLDIIKRYESKINVWISEKDSGIYDAMNKGAKLANGDFIIFMNSGDTFYEDETIKNVVKQISNENSVCFGRAKIKNNKISWLYPPEKYISGNIELWLKKALPNHQAMFLPKSFYKSTMYNLDYKIGSDSDYKFKAQRDCGFVFMDLIICEFELGGVSSDFNTFKMTKEILKDSWKISMEHRNIMYALERFIKILSKYIINKILGASLFSIFHQKVKG